MISKNKIKYLKSLEMKKHRQAESVFVAEGPKIVGDLLNAGFEATYLAVVECSDFASRLQNFDLKGVQIDFVTDDDLRKVSSLEAPQQVLAVLKQPIWQLDSNVASKELCLALDEVQNPGNLGTIIRLAAWFGIEHLFCSKMAESCSACLTMSSITRTNILSRVHPCLRIRCPKPQFSRS